MRLSILTFLIFTTICLVANSVMGQTNSALQPTLTHDLVEGRVKNELGKGVSGKIEFLDPATDKFVTSATLDENGSFKILLPKRSKYYFIIRSGYFTYFFKDESHIMSTSDVDVPASVSMNFSIYQYSEGTEIILHDLNFKTKLFEITDDHIPSLEFLVDFLNRNKTMKIQVAGHTDNVGSDQENKILSAKRSKSVVTYLEEKSTIDLERISSYGYGASRPVASNDNEAGRALNRRTSIYIITE